MRAVETPAAPTVLSTSPSTSRTRHPHAVDFGSLTVVVRRGRFSIRFGRRAALVCLLIAIATIVVALVSLATGDLPLSLGEVVSALVGADDGLVRTVVVEWRAPRVLAAIVFGAALGVAGAVFQSLTRNPLASPDLIGISAGSYTGALIVIILLGGSYLQIAAGSLFGGVAAAAIVYVLAYRRGMHGFRLIIVGIGVAAMLGSTNTFLVLRAKLEIAMDAAAWGAGSLGAVGWPQLVPAAVVVAVLLAALAAFVAPMAMLELGDDAATALGTRVEPTRVALIVGAVALTATVTAAAGPIAFVALAAPQLARRLAGSPGVTMAPAAFMGALLLLSADFIAQHALAVPVPVGIVTVVVGGGYLIWLLVREARSRA